MKVKLRQLLDEKDISLLRFCKRSGLCYKTLNQWILGITKSPSLDIVEKICYALGCSIDDLVELEIPKDADKIKRLHR